MSDKEVREFVKEEARFIENQVEQAFLYVIENLLKSICERRAPNLPKCMTKSGFTGMNPILSRNILLDAMMVTFLDTIEKIRMDETKLIKYFKS